MNLHCHFRSLVAHAPLAVVLTGLSLTCPASAAEALIHEAFESDLAPWWVEGAKRVWIEEGRLHVDADPSNGETGRTATVWHRQPIQGDVSVRFDAHVVSSTNEVNNINFFLLYSDPSGKPLHETADQRNEAEYRKYHGLNGYIFTFVNAIDRPQRPARIRIRRCPGFELLQETYDYHCQRGRTYHFEITRADSRLTIRVDGQLLLSAKDERPHEQGLIGLRTYRTHLWWDNVDVRSVE